MKDLQDLRFIELAEVHLEIIRNWRNSHDVAQYMYTEREISQEEQKKWFQVLENDTTKKYWIIEYRGKLIGVVNLVNINYEFRSAYWAFYIGETSVRGGGIGAKIEYSVLNYVFDELKLNKLLCEVFVSNEAVIKLHEKFGFRREAYYRNHIPKTGKFLDVIGLAIFKDEWEKIKQSFEFLAGNKD